MSARSDEAGGTAPPVAVSGCNTARPSGGRETARRRENRRRPVADRRRVRAMDASTYLEQRLAALARTLAPAQPRDAAYTTWVRELNAEACDASAGVCAVAFLAAPLTVAGCGAAACGAFSQYTATELPAPEIQESIFWRYTLTGIPDYAQLDVPALPSDALTYYYLNYGAAAVASPLLVRFGSTALLYLEFDPESGVVIGPTLDVVAGQWYTLTGNDAGNWVLTPAD
jgi:hypothetical protein